MDKITKQRKEIQHSQELYRKEQTMFFFNKYENQLNELCDLIINFFVINPDKTYVYFSGFLPRYYLTDHDFYSDSCDIFFKEELANLLDKLMKSKKYKIKFKAEPNDIKVIYYERENKEIKTMILLEMIGFALLPFVFVTNNTLVEIFLLTPSFIFIVFASFRIYEMRRWPEC